MKKKFEWTFDGFVEQVCGELGWFGEKFWSFYAGSSWFQRFAKFATTIFVTYWLVKGPLIVLFTEVFGVWYVLSTFIVGVLLTIANFVFGEAWIWKKHRPTMMKKR